MAEIGATATDEQADKPVTAVDNVDTRVEAGNDAATLEAYESRPGARETLEGPRYLKSTAETRYLLDEKAFSRRRGTTDHRVAFLDSYLAFEESLAASLEVGPQKERPVPVPPLPTATPSTSIARDQTTRGTCNNNSSKRRRLMQHVHQITSAPITSIMASVGHSRALAALDSGATVNLISLPQLQACELAMKSKITCHAPDNNIRVMAANGLPIVLLGQVTIPCSLGWTTKAIPFLVVPQLKPTVLLGIPALEAFGAILNFQDRACCFPDGNRVSFVDSIDTKAALRSDISLMAWEGGYASIVIPKYQHIKECEVYIEMPLQEPSQLAGAIAPGLATLRSGHTLVQIANLTGSRQKWKAKSNFPLLVRDVDEVKAVSVDPTGASVDAPLDVRPAVDDIPRTPPEMMARLQLGRFEDNNEQTELIETLWEARDIFAWNAALVPEADVEPMSLPLTTETPIFIRSHRHPEAHKQIIHEQTAEMLNAGIAQPSKSPYGFPVVLVRKANGKMRFCVDYRALNGITVKDKFPLPRIDDNLDRLAHATLFSTLDFNAGYWGVPIMEKDKHKTAFHTHEGLYEFNRMPFGLCNAPAHFSRQMQLIFGTLRADFLTLYLDDICVASTSFAQHMEHLRLTFAKIRKANLRLNPSKCSFALPEVRHLGFTVSAQGVKPNSAKVDAILQMPSPNTRKRTRSCIGTFSYYRRFIRNFSKIAKPIMDLLSTSATFQWTPACEEALTKLKAALTSAPILSYADFTKPFLVHTDASRDGLAGVLSQMDASGKEHPIAFISRKLSKDEVKWDMRELEALAVVWTCETFRPYLLGHKFTLYTDNSAVRYMLTNQKNAKLVRWSLRLSEFDFILQHRAGSANANADGPSRNPVDSISDVEPHPVQVTFPDALVCTVSTSDDTERLITDARNATNLTKRQLATAQREDAFFGPIFRRLDQARHDMIPIIDDPTIAMTSAFFTLRDGLLYRRTLRSERNDPTVKREILQLSVPAKLVSTVLTTYHCSVWGGHHGIAKTIAILRQRFFWKRMKRSVAMFIRGCLKCATVKSHPPWRHGLLQHITTSRPFEIVSMDFIQTLKMTDRGNQHILVMVDHFTNWVEAMPVKDMTAATVADIFYEQIICRHATPTTIVTDQGSQFLDGVIRHLNKNLAIKHKKTTPYHPQTNTKAERFNKSLIKGLACMVDKNQSDWDLLIPSYLLAYRSAILDGLHDSPFFLLYGRDPRLPADLLFEATAQLPRTADSRQTHDVSLLEDSAEAFDRLRQYKHRLVQRLQRAYASLEDSRRKANAKNKHLYDKHRFDPEFDVHSLALVEFDLQQTGMTTKLLPRFRGPYRITDRHSATNFALRHVYTGAILPNIHVKRMRAYTPYADDDLSSPSNEDV